ncbi:MAG: CBS domain-containing protein [Dehalococcoidales bacterium]|nr:CBS domain-containing protein [Dehalococcoidales bacterium]
MFIANIMKKNVITVTSDTLLYEARRIMDDRRIRRLPVVDEEELVGIVTRDDLDKIGPLESKPYTISEINYHFNKLTVGAVMHRDVVAVTPDTSVEAAIATAQSNRVGALPVMEKGKLVGIVTTNDFFLSILNPLLGIGLMGSRIAVNNCFKGPDIEKVIATLNGLRIGIVNLFLTEFPGEKRDLIVHLDVSEAIPAVEALVKAGFQAEIRAR